MTDPSERDIAGELREAAMACAKEHPRLAARLRARAAALDAGPSLARCDELPASAPASSVRRRVG